MNKITEAGYLPGDIKLALRPKELIVESSLSLLHPKVIKHHHKTTPQQQSKYKSRYRAKDLREKYTDYIPDPNFSLTSNITENSSSIPRCQAFGLDAIKDLRLLLLKSRIPLREQMQIKCEFKYIP
jgi:hypothetical protein